MNLPSLRLVLVLLALAAAAPALAHPHVWVTTKASLVFGPDGKLAAVRHRWTFDEGYSAFAVEGLDKNKDGVTSPDELADLARTNLESLVEFGYFTTVKANGAKQPTAEPRAPAMSLEGGRLTLSFELPLREPASGKTLALDVSDPSFFVDFRMAEGEDALTLDGAPKGCAASVSRPKPLAAPGVDLGESLFQSLRGAQSGAASPFAGRALVACP